MAGMGVPNGTVGARDEMLEGDSGSMRVEYSAFRNINDTVCA